MADRFNKLSDLTMDEEEKLLETIIEHEVHTNVLHGRSLPFAVLNTQ
jgi:hypothetical protein